ncbi:hypothetical protein G6F35_017901 [Rhizopus arrhizus]|nr:hypothetical protein G6F35_017901 [Rhizopus arrhizus]
MGGLDFGGIGRADALAAVSLSSVAAGAPHRGCRVPGGRVSWGSADARCLVVATCGMAGGGSDCRGQCLCRHGVDRLDRESQAA